MRYRYNNILNDDLSLLLSLYILFSRYNDILTYIIYRRQTRDRDASSRLLYNI